MTTQYLIIPKTITSKNHFIFRLKKIWKHHKAVILDLANMMDEFPQVINREGSQVNNRVKKSHKMGNDKIRFDHRLR